ncbi:General negative regulator of transcription subunit 1 [Astathelohania contejeani]|uniref:General negative regulator of transcription subunit 1 n=1 Tax=Astathelohania contejeani TaxID=164912 RepID=A0ABQ7HX65_9MICR|nr:General negative regulator of transcription subunit 1 [Thelohania contejeani]
MKKQEEYIYDLRGLINDYPLVRLNRRSTSDMIRNIRKRREISEAEIADVICLLVDSAGEQIQHAEIMQGMKESLSNTNWLEVYEHLDTPGFVLRGIEAYYRLIDSWTTINGENTFPYKIFFRRWKNEEARQSFLSYLISSDDRKTKTYQNVFLTKIIHPEDIKRLPRSGRFKTLECRFNCVELFQALEDNEILIQRIKSTHFEWAILGLAFLLPNYENIFEEIFNYILENEPVNTPVYSLLKPQLILEKMARNKKVPLSKMLDIVLEHKFFPIVCESLKPAFICFELIILSAKRDHLNLNIWISNSFSHKKDTFIVPFLAYLIEKYKNVDQTNLETTYENPNERFTHLETTVTIIHILDQLSKLFSKEASHLYNKLKTLLPLEVRNITQKKTGLESKANEFISALLNQQRSVSETVALLSKFLSGNVYEKELALKIFSTLIESYNNLTQIPYHEIADIFLGKLLERGILTNFYTRRLLSCLRHSLRQKGAEYRFALTVLRTAPSIITDYPFILAGLENDENIKELTGRSTRDADDLIEDDRTDSRIDSTEVLQVQFNEIVRFTETEMENMDWIFTNYPDNVDINPKLFVQYFLSKKLLDSNPHNAAHYFLSLGHVYAEQLLNEIFNFLRCLCKYSLEKNFERKYSQYLGILTGRMTLAQNRIFTRNEFDIRAYISSAQDSRRMSFCISFVSAFLKQGKYGIIFRPYNPYLMAVLDQLNEVYYTVPTSLKEEIEILFIDFNLPLKPFNPTGRSTERHLAQYILGTMDPLCKDVVKIAIDFSVREIASAIVDRICIITRSCAGEVFKSKDGKTKIEDGNSIKEMRHNLEINLARALSHVSAHDPIKASISGNVTYFLKLANIEMDSEYINNIAEENADICCNIIERAVVTQISNGQQGVWCRGVIPYNLAILKEVYDFNPVVISPITIPEYNLIKEKLIAIGKTMPDKKINIILREWKSLVGYISSNNMEIIHSQIKKILSLINSDNSRDELAETLCKSVVAYLFKMKENKEIVLNLLNEIFFISPKTSHEVIEWFIYSDDARRLDIDINYHMIRLRMFDLVEYDQYLARCVNKHKSFIISLLNRLILSNLKICTPYDFIYTIEALSKLNEECYCEDVCSFLQGVSTLVGGLGECRSMAVVFEEYIRNTCYTPFPMFNVAIPYKGKEFSLFVEASLCVALEHFLHNFKYPSSFCFLKVDALAKLVIKKDFIRSLRTSTEMFLRMLERGNYTFHRVYARFISELLKLADHTESNHAVVFELLMLLSPRRIPSFALWFVELVKCDFVCVGFMQGLDSRGLSLCKEVCLILNNSNIYEFKRKSEGAIKSFFDFINQNARGYLSTIAYELLMYCPNSYIKNELAKAVREVKISTNIDFSNYRAIHTGLNTYLRNNCTIPFRTETKIGILLCVLADNLNNLNNIILQNINANAVRMLRELVRIGYWDEVGGVIIERMMAGNACEGMEMAVGVLEMDEFSEDVKRNIFEMLNK